MKLETLRQRANDALNAEEYAAYLEYMSELEIRETSLPILGSWLAWAAYASWCLQREDVNVWLERAVEAGYAQPELLPEDFEQYADWNRFAALMRKNLPRPWVIVQRFPEFNTDVPVWNQSLTSERRTGLLERLPPPAVSAWDTATGLLAWVQQRWKHDGNNNPGDIDALELLERSAHGERFRCVEYGTVLEAALNARGIPARRCGLRSENYHAGTGRGHVVVEAWIDEFNRWVILDGQNGGYWQLEGLPLGGRELCELYWGRAVPPNFVNLNDRPLEDASRRLWFSYFAQVHSGQAIWVAPQATFTPQFQGKYATETTRVSTDPNRVWPDLSGFDTGFTLLESKPALKLRSPHPSCLGFSANGWRVLGNPAIVPLESFRGVPRLEVAAYTAFATLRAGVLHLEWAEAAP